MTSILSLRVSSRSTPVTFSSMTHSDTNTDRSYQTNKSSLIPPTILPKYFNVPFAIQHGYFRCIRYLLQLCYDPNERDSQLRTSLILCSYVENDRWSLSMAQNLLEKGAKIGLEDHAKRNAMHHACALQRIHLVQLYLSCLDFKMEAKDCEGNTCLHYVAITGNCEIAELLIKSAEKMDIRLDQHVNQDGCSAAVLALKYGHIECANQITHRDWDEFFVIPRPLSIYETPKKIDDHQTVTTTAISRKQTKTTSNASSTIKSDIRPSTLSFGLLKIIFNEADATYSTRLAGICNERKQTHNRRRLRQKKQELLQKLNEHDQTESNVPGSTHYCSTEALVNEVQSSRTSPECTKSFNGSDDGNNTGRTSPRVQLLMQQHFSNKTYVLNANILHPNDDEMKSKIQIPTVDHRASISSANHTDPTASILYDSPRTTNKLQRPKTAVVSRNQTSVNAIGIPSRLSSAKTQPSSSLLSNKKSKKIPSSINRPSSASFTSKQHQQQQQHSNLGSEVSSYSQTLYAGRPLSAVLQNRYRQPPVQRKVDSSCSIREAKGATNRYNKPEELFGLKPEELFGLSDHQPKIINHHTTNSNKRLIGTNVQKQQYIWQQEVNKLVDLYNVHHSKNYRASAVPPPPPPPPPPVAVEEDTLTDLTQMGRTRRLSMSKSSSASVNVPRQNLGSQRPSVKWANT